jgi:hypothetical protein
MKIGTRIVRPEEVSRWDAELLQITVYGGMEYNLSTMRKCVRSCREARIPFVIHPVGYSLLDEGGRADLREMAMAADLALILHDERTGEGQRIEGGSESVFRGFLDELRSLASISFENATDTADVRWFWKQYADAITLDIGHAEVAGFDSVAFVQTLDEETLRKIQYVHIHRNNGTHGGITDHWPLTPGCREVEALRKLLRRKSGIGVILELNETEQIGESLGILRHLRDELGI